MLCRILVDEFVQETECGREMPAPRTVIFRPVCDELAGECAVRSQSRISIVKRLSIYQAIVILIAMGTFSVTLSSLISKRIEDRTEGNLKQQIALTVNLLSAYHAAVAESARTLQGVFRAGLPGEFSIDSALPLKAGERQVPQLKSGSVLLNGNTQIVDRFSQTTHAASSIFVLSGEDFVPIASSFKDERGNRIAGAPLDRSNPAYEKLIKGESYTGKAGIANRNYMCSFEPIKDAQGRVVGVNEILLDFTDGLQKLSDQIAKVKIGKTGYIYALDARPGKGQGTLRIHPSQAGKNIIGSKDADGVEFIRAMIERRQGVSRYAWINQSLGEKKPRNKIAAYDYLAEWDWVIAAGSYVDELNSEGIFLRNAMLLATVLVIVALVSIFVMIARRWISRPLQRAVLATDQLAAGDFTQIAHMQVDDLPTDNEIEQLERGIYRMARSLCGLLEKIRDAAERLLDATQDISESVAQTTETSRNQSDKTARVATAMLEMSTTVDEVSKNSQQAADAARVASETAHEGGNVVGETLATMRLIANSTNAVSARISELGESSNKIGSIALVISEIAGQTNLLALNAAIEAARAGEQGRGFAVVAGEVRRLAERTAAATEEISKMIGNIQSEARKAVEAMRGESDEVALGVTKTESAGRALDQIIGMAGQVGKMIEQIAAASTEQSAATDEVNGNVSSIAEMAAQSSNSANEMARACTGLSSLAMSLQEVVGQFRLSE